VDAPDRRCIYTVLFGGYESLMEQYVAREYDVPLICFTDDASMTSDSWDIRVVTPAFAGDPIRSARSVKILAHEALPDFDTSLYVDNTVLLAQDPAQIFAALLPDDAPMAVIRHSYRETLDDEFDAVIELAKDASWVCMEQREHYRSWAPDSLQSDPIWTGVMLRRHHQPDVVATMKIWRDHVLRYSRRDQLSLPMVLGQTGLRLVVHEFDNFISPYWEWPRRANRVHAYAQLSFGPEQVIASLKSEVDTLRSELDQVRERAAGQTSVLQRRLAKAQVSAARADAKAATADAALTRARSTPPAGASA
jgi:hypothetical protein